MKNNRYDESPERKQRLPRRIQRFGCPKGKATEPILLDLPTVAAKLSVSVDTVRAMIAARELPYIALGPRTNRVREADLLKMIDRKQVAART